MTSDSAKATLFTGYFPMKLVLYNIRYGTGIGRQIHLPWDRYLRRTSANLERITGFVRSLKPDIVGLVEVDAGSYRTGRNNQAKVMAEALGHYHCYESKYSSRSLARLVPVVNKQGNAFLTSDRIRNQRFHFFRKGMKRLVIELELESVTLFLVHLSLKFRIRHHQLADLYSLLQPIRKPHIVAGDFNAFRGEQETRLFLAATGLQSANTRALPSFPSWAPRRELDFILHTPDIEITHFEMPKITLSDHLPLVCDFRVR